MIECTPDCKYKKLFEDCEGKRQRGSESELVRCNERQKVKDKKIKELNKKILLLTIISTVAATLIGKEALEFIGEWLGMLESVGIGGGENKTASIVPAPGALAVFALPLLMGKSRRRK